MNKIVLCCALLFAVSSGTAFSQEQKKQVCGKDATAEILFTGHLAVVAKEDKDVVCSGINPVSLLYKKEDGVCFAYRKYPTRILPFAVPCTPAVEKLVPKKE